MRFFATCCWIAGLASATVPALFRDVAKESGIDFKLVSGRPEKHYIIESMTGGVALFDYNVATLAKALGARSP